jgi:histidinol-phosphatase (PHP family)
MIDYHIHTYHSIDAEGTIDEYCQRALHIGLKEICITNHCELDPARQDSWIRFSNNDKQPVTNRGLKRLAHEVEVAKELYKKSGLTVRLGLEVGYYEGIEPRLREVMNGVQFDFVLGSIHCLNHICIDSSREYEAYFSRHTTSVLLDNYCEALENLITSGLFDSLGHIDVYKKYGLKFYGDSIRNISEDALSEIFRLMKEHNIALEINTAGWRCVDEPYPSPLFMKCAREQGLTLITIGSDCHKVADLGKGIIEATHYAKSFGFDAVYGFDKRQPIKINI